MNKKLRVWWIPQLGVNEPFYIPVSSVEEGKKLLDILAVYDAYQLQNDVKPDFVNTGGLQIYNPEVADWEDWYLETEDYCFYDIDEYLSNIGKEEEFERFNEELFKQIDWEKLEAMK